VLDFSVTFFITILNLLVLYLVLRKLLWKPVTAFMDARAKKIRDDLEGASAAKLAAEASADLYQSLLSEADAEAARLVAEGEERARLEARAIVERAQAEAAESRRQAEAAALREAERAREALAADLGALVAEAAARLAGREALAADEAAADAIVRDLEAGRAR